MRHLHIICLVFAASFLVSSSASAQFNPQAVNRTRSLYRGGQSAQSAILGRSTVSPYLALTDLTGNGGDLSSNYFTSVRPRIEAQQQQRMQQQNIQGLQRNISSMRAAAAQRNQNGVRATGHPTRFGMYLQYYPGMGR